MKKGFTKTGKRSGCAISMALDEVGDKWSLLILRDLMFTCKRSYSELKSSEENIASNILAARLAMLEKNKIIAKKPDPADSRRILYFLTEKGIELLPVVIELMQWMVKYNEQSSSCAGNIRLYKKDRVVMYKELMKELKRNYLD